MGRISIIGDRKLCTGPLHREGVLLPITRFYILADGKPISQCIACRNYYLGRDADAGLISVADAMPMLERLFELAGGKTHAAARLGLPRNYFSRQQTAIRRVTFNKARRLLEELDRERHYNRGEAEIVDPEPLGSVLRAWVVTWLAEHPLPDNDPQLRNGSPAHMGPVQWLAEKTEIHIRRVSGICNGEFERVGLSQADALLTAIGEFDLLGFEIPVKMNPTWSTETWHAYMAARGCI